MVATALAGLAWFVTPAHALLYDKCEAAVAERISELGISPDDVAGVRTFPVIAASRTGPLRAG